MPIKLLIKENMLPKTLGVEITTSNNFIRKEYILDSNNKFYLKETYKNKEYIDIPYTKIETWTTFIVNTGIVSYTTKLKIKEEVIRLIEQLYSLDTYYEETARPYETCIYKPEIKRNIEIYYTLDNNIDEYFEAQIEYLSFTLTKTILIYPMF